MDAQPADGCVGKRKRHNTHFKSLHLSEEIQAAIKTAQADFERRASEQSHPFTPALPTPPPLPDCRSRKPRRRLLLTLIIADRAVIFYYTSNNLTLRIHLTSSCSRKLTPLFPCRATWPTIKWLITPSRHGHPHPADAHGQPGRFTLPCGPPRFYRDSTSETGRSFSLYTKCLQTPRVTEDSSLLALLRAAAVRDCSLTPRNLLRVGNSVCRDTTPDLRYCPYVHDARWSSTHQSLGSDHYVLTMQVCTSPCKPRPHAIHRTDWDAFRARCQHSATPDIEDLSQWTDQLLADLDGVTASIPTMANRPAIYSRLAHLHAAHRSLTNRWNKQRHNRRLHCRIADLDREIKTHTTALARQQWEQLCSGLSSQLGCKQSWHLAPTPSSRPYVRERTIQAYPGDTSSMMADLAAKYFRLLPSDELDADITEAEAYAALHRLRTTSTPGPDRVPNKLLRSLDAPSHIEHTLQCATDVVMDHVHAAGLTCSAGKSALLLIRPPDRHRLKTLHPTIMFHANSTPVPVVSHLARVLGLILQSNRRNTHTIDQLSLSIQQTARMLARVRAQRQAVVCVDADRYTSPGDTFTVARVSSRPPRRWPRSRQS
ncbi:hypothetical protein HPB52_007293 [Rhipicephalus sanguineus]|uniref:Tick transposon n=1 Tax=Rhipicephalus sanguineus TaxID=34632 RepID=A0A9D4QI22_RHISA|nr:hypothetical protein HPB52_007293 [Rhipicephalus sanguineus]